MTREDQLFRRLAQGDKEAIEDLVRLYYGEILRYCFWHLPNRCWAEDAVQETFLKAIRYLDHYHHKGKFKAFLYRIAANTCVDLQRKKYPEPLSENVGYQEKGFGEIEAAWDFTWLLQQVTKEERELLVLRFAQNLTLREISSILDLPLRTVQSRLRAILKRLQKTLEKEEKRHK